ncbi:TetR/AcrR family transcriptional regulator [Rhodococcus tibetensis]|uniref:TetR/AcrR family transcriptional regulator n=1 Tax=Rhodococcus tibetensis TaxID=2965064 RepID=A0ABT1Q8S9_9NOCA|nr:TetR/AcrR family transcriptional regulator [Rhodococcus sp. FXJ9.536]MCQ4118636.1 TetR/AcrR family transcriptional regulator [Rhodococcus sp. FXJ9.536]
MTTGPGRPRLTSQRRPGRTTPEEILDAAGELFTTKGFAATSTREIADMVGIRQASLYHHFANKEEILVALLEETVSPALATARLLATVDAPAVVRLHALATYDVTQLTGTRWNLGALYLLPELRTERFAPFRAQRMRLRSHYQHYAEQALIEITGGDTEVVPGLTDLPFRIVESAIATRADVESGAVPVPESADAAALLADACLRALGWATPLDGIRARSRVLLAEMAGGTPRDLRPPRSDL